MHVAQVTLAHVNSQPLKNHARIFEKKKTLYVFFLFPDQLNTFNLFLDPVFPWWAGVRSNIVL